MANQNPNRCNNALPEKAKVTGAVQEVIRRCKNTSRQLEEEELRRELYRYIGELKLGGYTKLWRCEVLEAGLLGYGRMWASEVKEGMPINRPEASRRVKKSCQIGRPQIGLSPSHKETQEARPTRKDPTQCSLCPPHPRGDT